MRTDKQCNWKSNPIHKLRSERKVKKRNQKIVQSRYKNKHSELIEKFLDLSRIIEILLEPKSIEDIKAGVEHHVAMLKNDVKYLDSKCN